METKRCQNCNKVIKGESHWVVMRQDWLLFTREWADVAIPPRYNQGEWEVGPECYKKVQQARGAGWEITR